MMHAMDWTQTLANLANLPLVSKRDRARVNSMYFSVYWVSKGFFQKQRQQHTLFSKCILVLPVYCTEHCVANHAPYGNRSLWIFFSLKCNGNQPYVVLYCTDSKYYCCERTSSKPTTPSNPHFGPSGDYQVRYRYTVVALFALYSPIPYPTVRISKQLVLVRRPRGANSRGLMFGFYGACLVCTYFFSRFFLGCILVYVEWFLVPGMFQYMEGIIYQGASVFSPFTGYMSLPPRLCVVFLRLCVVFLPTQREQTNECRVSLLQFVEIIL